METGRGGGQSGGVRVTEVHSVLRRAFAARSSLTFPRPPPAERLHAESPPSPASLSLAPARRHLRICPPPAHQLGGRHPPRRLRRSKANTHTAPPPFRSFPPARSPAASSDGGLGSLPCPPSSLPLASSRLSSLAVCWAAQPHTNPVLPLCHVRCAVLPVLCPCSATGRDRHLPPGHPGPPSAR